MSCPNYNFEQNESAECIKCGIINRKYLDKKSQATPQHAKTRSGKGEGADLSSTEEISEKNHYGLYLAAAKKTFPANLNKCSGISLPAKIRFLNILPTF